MLPKINLGTTLIAVCLFFLPWIDIQCSQKNFATQTGIQLIYGGATASKEMPGSENSKLFGDGNSAQPRQATPASNPQLKESLGWSPLILIAFGAALAAAASALQIFRNGEEDEEVPSNRVGILSAIALACIAGQMMLGFPVESKMSEQMALAAKSEAAKSARQPNPANVGEGMAQGMAQGMAAAIMSSQIRTNAKPPIYFTLIMLGIPTLIMSSGFLDKLRKNRNV